MEGTYLEEIRAKIDKEILELRLRISKLSFQRNTLAPVAHLPPEVLCRIFVEYINEARALAYDYIPDTLTWICRHWRDVAISCADLWTDIDFSHPPSVELFLTRSKNAELDIFIPNIPLINPSPCIAVLLQQANRIQSLGLFVHGDQIHSLTLPGAWDLPAPRLRELELDGINLPNRVFNETTPLLRTVSLTACVVPWQAPLFSTLTKLVISGPLNLVPVNDFIPILKNSPQLAELHLGDVLDASTIPPGQRAEAPIVLPNLRLLTAPREDILIMSYLFQCIVLSGVIQTIITLTGSTGDVTDSAELLRVFYTSIFSHRGVPRLSLLYGYQGFIVSAFVHDLSGPDADAPIILNLRNLGTEAPNLGAISMAHLILNTLEHLTLSVLNISNEDLGPVFGGLPHLRTLELKIFAAKQMMDFFVEEGKRVAITWPNILADYDLAAKDSSRDNIGAGTLTADVIGLGFRALEHMVLSIPYSSHFSSDLPEAHSKWFIFNLYARRTCGIGLKKLVHFNWIIDDTAALEVACRVVDDMQREVAFEKER